RSQITRSPWTTATCRPGMPRRWRRPSISRPKASIRGDGSWSGPPAARAGTMPWVASAISAAASSVRRLAEDPATGRRSVSSDTRVFSRRAGDVRLSTADEPGTIGDDLIDPGRCPEILHASIAGRHHAQRFPRAEGPRGRAGRGDTSVLALQTGGIEPAGVADDGGQSLDRPGDLEGRVIPGGQGQGLAPDVADLDGRAPLGDGAGQ